MDNHFENSVPREDNADHERNTQAAPEPVPAYCLQTKKPKNGWLIALAFAFIGSIAGSIITLGISNNLAKTDTQIQEQTDISYVLESRRDAAKLQILPIDGATERTPAQVYAANVNSTVGITTSISTNYWGYQTTSAASGSGFIITADGYILTNHHVVADSDSISVSLYNGAVYAAELIGYDESNDIAVLKVDAEDLVPVVLGDSDKLNVGDSVVAIGNPLGELTFSLTAGTVSAKDRKVTLSSTITMDLIQTDCAINSGNSGGALFNLYGEVIGITNAKYSSSSASDASIDNIGFAIPVQNVMGIVKSIIEKGYISKPYIGVSVSDISPETQLYGIPMGAAVQTVAENGPAAKAGLAAGDIITQVNGNAIRSSSDLVEIVGKCIPGDALVLTVFRRGETTDITVIIDEQVRPAKEETQQQQSAASRPGSFPPGFPFGRY